MPASDYTARRTAFRKLHESGCFVIPNPWDTGSARYLRHLGFQALASTSAGFAFARGLPDAGVSRDSMLGNIAEIVRAVDLPVNADFEAGYAHEPEGVAANVRLCVETGVAGLSIEDSTGDRQKPLYELPLAVERIAAARAAIDATRHRCPAHRTSRVLPGGPPGTVPGSDAAPASVRGSRRGCALRTRNRATRGDTSAGRGGQSQTGEHSDEPEYRAAR